MKFLEMCSDCVTSKNWLDFGDDPNHIMLRLELLSWGSAPCVARVTTENICLGPSLVTLLDLVTLRHTV